MTRTIPRSGIPGNARLLFAGVVPAARAADGQQAVLAPDGSRILVFDRAGYFERSVGDTVIAKGIGVMAASPDWIVVEREGGVHRLSADGRILSSFTAPFGTAVLARTADGVVAARSPFAVATKQLDAGAPLLSFATLSGQLSGTMDTVSPSRAPLAGFLTNSGLVAADSNHVYFASFTRDEIRAYDLKGRRQWISQRALDWAAEPTAVPTPSGTSLTFDAVNLGLAADGNRLYVLSYTDSTEHTLRLDAIDPTTGILQITTILGAGPWLISLDEKGAVWTAPVDTLLALATPRVRAPLPHFRLATIKGDTFDLASTRGRVTLVNFWASWCPPCRQEFPLMNQLARDLAPEEFTVVAVNEDVKAGSAEAFLRETPAHFTVPMGRGAMQSLVGYRGLPYTVLLDREGRIMERYFGFGGAAQFAKLRQRIDRALREP